MMNWINYLWDYLLEGTQYLLFGGAYLRIFCFTAVMR